MTVEQTLTDDEQLAGWIWSNCASWSAWSSTTAITIPSP